MPDKLALGRAGVEYMVRKKATDLDYSWAISYGELSKLANAIL